MQCFKDHNGSIIDRLKSLRIRMFLDCVSLEFIAFQELLAFWRHKVQVQKDLSDALFTPKMDIFKQTILNTAHIKALEIFPLARESLFILTSTSRSIRNQSCLQCP